MPGVVTLLGSATFNTNSGTKTVTATPAVGDLIVIITAHSANTSDAVPTDNNPDGLGVYTVINTCVKNTSADKMKAFVRNAPIGSASSTVFTHAPGTSTGGGLAVVKVTGINKQGSAAIVQSQIQSNQAAAGTPTPVLGANANTNNSLVGAVFNASNPAGMTPRSSPVYSELVDTGYTTTTHGLEVMSINSGETATSIAWGGTSATAFCSIVFEIDTGANAIGRAPTYVLPPTRKFFPAEQYEALLQTVLSGPPPPFVPPFIPYDSTVSWPLGRRPEGWIQQSWQLFAPAFVPLPFLPIDTGVAFPAKPLFAFDFPNFALGHKPLPFFALDTSAEFRQRILETEQYYNFSLYAPVITVVLPFFPQELLQIQAKYRTPYSDIPLNTLLYLPPYVPPVVTEVPIVVKLLQPGVMMKRS